MDMIHSGNEHHQNVPVLFKQKIIVHPIFLFSIFFIFSIYLFYDNLSGFWRFDDPQILAFIANNPILGSFYKPEIWKNLGAPFFTPLLTLSYWVDFSIFGLSPTKYYIHHMVSLAILLSLTYKLLLRQHSPQWSLLGTTLFAIGFPTEIVAQQLMTRHYIEGLVLAILSYMSFTDDKMARYQSIIIGTFLYLLAILAKEIYIPLAPYLFYLEIRRTNFKRAFIKTLPYLVALAIYLPWRFYMLNGIGGYTSELIPSTDCLLKFIGGIRYWIFPDGMLGWIGFGSLVLLLAIGHIKKTLSFATTALAFIFLILPLLPVITTMPYKMGTTYFIPHRYMFLTWWATAFAITQIGARLQTQSIKLEQEEPHRFQAIKICVPILIVFIFVSATLQERKRENFNNLKHLSENIYQLAWAGDNNSSIKIPKEIVKYHDFMFEKISIIKNTSRENLPKIETQTTK